MASRWWGLNRRQTVIAFGATIVIAVLVAFLLGGNGTTSTPASPSSDPGGPTRVAPGTRGPAHAVWTFGFETLRFDERLRHPQQLVGVKGFGSVLGVSGRTYMYDAASGRIGVLRSASNRLETLANAPRGTASDDAFAPSIAADTGALWLVSAPGRLTRFDLTTKQVGAPIDVAAGGAPVATGVVANSDAVFTATRDETGVTVARLDPGTRAVAPRVHLDLAPTATLDGLAVDGTSVWVVTAGTVEQLRAADLTRRGTIPIAPRSPGSVKGAVAAGGAVWLLGDNGATLLRVDRDTAEVGTAMKILPRTPSAFRIPAGLVTDGRHVWAMVQKGDTADDHSVRVTGYDASRRRPTPAVDLPSQLFFGGLAAT